MKKINSVFLVVCFLLSSCSSTGGNKTNPAHGDFHPSAFSDSSEEAMLGKKIHTQILSSFYPYTDPKVVSYINEIGSNLALQAERKDLPYQFTLLYDDKIYATSAPGGYVYLTTGLVHFLDNESELAAVMAHEIGELQYHDPRLSRSKKILDAVTKGGTTIGPAFGQIGALAALGLVMMNAVAESHNGKKSPSDRILQADVKALHYMVAAGYDPQGLPDFLYKFLNAEKQIAPYFYDYYQSRPINQERFQIIQNEFPKLPLEGKQFSTHRDVYQETTKGIREIYKQ